MKGFIWRVNVEAKEQQKHVQTKFPILFSYFVSRIPRKFSEIFMKSQLLLI